MRREALNFVCNAVDQAFSEQGCLMAALAMNSGILAI